MGDLEPVLEAILNTAKTRKTEIEDDVKRRIGKMSSELEKEKEEYNKRFIKELDEKTERIYESEKVKERQLLKDAALKAKSDFLKEVTSRAKRYICELDDEKYSEFLKNLYKSCAISGKCIIYLNERDKKRLKRGIFENAEVAKDVIIADGGFVVVCDNIRYDCTIDSIFEEKYEEIADRINALIKKERG